MQSANKFVVELDYTNHGGERATRLIRPFAGTNRFGRSDWHPEPQWLFDAFDIAKDEERLFALSGVHSWKAAR